MRADARRNYERLLAVAEDVFREQGTSASLEEIARRAQVGIGTLYRHFPTRDTVLEALLRDRFTDLGEQARAAVDAADPRQALADWLARFTTNAATYRGMSATVLGAMRREGSALYESCHAMTAAGQALVEHAQRAGAIRADVPPMDVLTLAGAVAWSAEQVTDDPDRPARLLALVLDALTPR